jgi:hypothetical protein
MKRLTKERKRRERALKRWKKRSWLTDSLKNKRISRDLVRRKAEQEQVKP